MDFLGVGPLELILVIILALVFVGPRDLAKFGRDAGRFLNRLYRSQAWRTVNEASREIRNLPTRLAREAELDSVKRDLEQAGKDLKDSVKSAGEGLEKDVKSAGEGKPAWAPRPQPAVPASQAPAPLEPAATAPPGGDAPPGPPPESPFAEG